MKRIEMISEITKCREFNRLKDGTDLQWTVNKDAWTPVDLVYRDYLNNGSFAFCGLSQDEGRRAVWWIDENKMELLKQGYMSPIGLSNSGCVLWDYSAVLEKQKGCVVVDDYSLQIGSFQMLPKNLVKLSDEELRSVVGSKQITNSDDKLLSLNQAIKELKNDGEIYFGIYHIFSNRNNIKGVYIEESSSKMGEHSIGNLFQNSQFDVLDCLAQTSPKQNKKQSMGMK